jgi:acyl-CoA-binding protein
LEIGDVTAAVVAVDAVGPSGVSFLHQKNWNAWKNIKTSSRKNSPE